MKTKTYILTEIEKYAIRDALIEQYQRMRRLKMQSPIAIEMFNALKELKDQFIEDCCK